MTDLLFPGSVLVQTGVAVVEHDDDGDVLHHPLYGARCRLNETGWEILRLLEEPVRVDALCSRLATVFGVDPDACMTATLPFVTELFDLGFADLHRPESPQAALRARYLELLKRALTNLIYPEHELRIRHLLHADHQEQDRLDRDRLLRDIRYRSADAFETLVRAKQVGAILHREVTRYSHTAIGMKRLNNLQACAEQVFAEAIPGDFMEAGVCQGGATIFMRALQVAYEEAGRRTWVADSFQGVPPPSHEVDLHYELDLSESRQPWIAISRQMVEDHFRTYDLLDDNVHFLEGWFKDTLPEAPVEQIAILRLDGDLYESTWDTLVACYDRVVPGGFVVVDDYGALPPCRMAVDDFRRERGITDRIRTIDWTGVFWRKSA